MVTSISIRGMWSAPPPRAGCSAGLGHGITPRQDHVAEAAATAPPVRDVEGRALDRYEIRQQGGDLGKTVAAGVFREVREIARDLLQASRSKSAMSRASSIWRFRL